MSTPCSRAGVSTLSVFLLIMTIMMTPPSAKAQSPELQTQVYAIPAGSLHEALKALASQSDLSVVYSPELVAARDTQGLSGSFTPREALRHLLAGTGLEWDEIDASTFVLKAAPAHPEEPAEPSPSTEVEDAEDWDELEKIVVTGTHIRGTGVAVGSNVTLISQDEIDRSGHATVQDFLKTLPQVFQGGASEDARVGGSAASNAFSGSGVDLRGLGTDATLTLVNGRRLPLAGAANFFDISIIPVTAIDRIELLPDGASAIYGSDAISGVVNIILREDYEGFETRMRYGVSTEGDAQELKLGQVFGSSWSSGNLLMSFEHYQRELLANSARRFTASADLRPLGGQDFRDIFANPGNILSPFTGQPAFAIPPGQDGTALSPEDLLPGVVNLRNQYEQAEVLPRQRRNTIFAALSQDLSDNITIFAEGRYGKRDFRQLLGGFPSAFLVPASNPYFVDPFGFGFSILSYNFLDELGPVVFDGEVEDRSAVLGGTIQFARDWQLQAYGSYSDQKSERESFNQVDNTALSAALADPDPLTAFNPFGEGSNTNPATIENIRRAPLGNALDSSVSSLNATADGSLFDLPGGAVKLAAGVDYRKEDFTPTTGVPVFGRTSFPQRREVTAVFGELFIPIVGESNRRTGVNRLAISVSGRHESYSGVNDDETTNPKVGFAWSPLEGLSLRGTYGTSFKAPNLPDLDESNNVVIIFPLTDPKSETGQTFTLLRGGKNADLENETSHSWTFGADATLPALPRLRLQFTYFNIDFEDRIASPGVINQILIQESRFAGIITRDPSADQIAEICNLEAFARLGTDPELCNLLPIGAIVDARLNNTARTKIQGIDVSAYYSFEPARFGQWDLGLAGTHFLKYDEAFSLGTSSVPISDTVGNPVDLRLRGSITWSHASGTSAAAFINYTGGYTDNVSLPERRIGSWTTLDLSLGHTTPQGGGILDGLTTSLNILNLFDRDPPFVNNQIGLGYDPNNAGPLGRYVSLNVVKLW